jgi:ribosomal-protein-alanine N-acetyltransferase
MSVILSTPRLEIRELRPEDAVLLYLYSREECARANLPDEVLADEAAAESLIRTLRRNYPAAYPLVYGITRREDGLLIGHISLSVISEGIEIGYAIAKAYQGQGFAREAATAFSSWAKEQFSLPAIYGLARASNEASRRVLEASGYRFLREEMRSAWGQEILYRVYVSM